MASNKNAPELKPTNMSVPKDDCRDPQFHLDITKKNDQSATKRPS